MTPRYELLRQGYVGRGYDLVRDGEPAGELRRRAIFRPRYEIDCGPHRWVARRFGSGDKPAELIDRGSEQTVAVWHAAGPLEVAVPAWRPRVELAWGVVGRDLAFADPDGRAWVTFGSQNEAMKVRVEAHGPATGWPAEDPDAGFLVAIAFGFARIVWQIDESAARST